MCVSYYTAFKLATHHCEKSILYISLESASLEPSQSLTETVNDNCYQNAWKLSWEVLAESSVISSKNQPRSKLMKNKRVNLVLWKKRACPTNETPYLPFN